jgi:pilus assembly protein Flp/PilA
MFRSSKKGQGLVEYALILVLVAVVVIAVLLILGPTIGNVFTKVNGGVAEAGVGGNHPRPTPPENTPAPAVTPTAVACTGGPVGYDTPAEAVYAFCLAGHRPSYVRQGYMLLPNGCFTDVDWGDHRSLGQIYCPGSY